MPGESDVCRSCQAPILWGITSKGKAMPLDLEPVEAGNVFLSPDGSARVLNKAALEEARLTNTPLRKSHHATCRHGRAWRR